MFQQSTLNKHNFITQILHLLPGPPNKSWALGTCAVGILWIPGVSASQAELQGGGLEKDGGDTWHEERKARND